MSSAPPVSSNESKKYSVIKNVFVAVIYLFIVVIGVVILLFFIWLSINLNVETFIKPKEAVVRLVSFSATHFNIADGDLTATWEAKLAIENHNKDFKATFTEIETHLFYQEPVNGLGDGFKGSFIVDKESNTTVIVKSSISKRDRQPQRWVVDDIEKERNGGSVSLGLGIRLDLVFKTESRWILSGIHKGIYISCGDLKVVFAAESTTGTLANGGVKGCSYFVS